MQAYELIDTIDNDAHDYDWSRERLEVEAEIRNRDEGWNRYIVKPQGFSERNYREMTDSKRNLLAARRQHAAVSRRLAASLVSQYEFIRECGDE